MPEDLAIGLGILLVIGGPSGVGKGTIVRRLLERDPNLWLSVSSTTRPRRDGEVDGRDYVFMSRPEFERLRDEGGFVESFDVYGDLKGTPWRPVEDHLTAGDDVVLEIDVKGAMAIREAFPDAVLVFVRAPSREVQRKRLEGRGQDDPEAVERRLAEAEAEEALADRFDAVVVNDDVGRAVEEVAAILARSRDAGEPPK